jgi:hypothetical protein
MHLDVRSLLEPNTWKSCTFGSEGAWGQQCPPATRHVRRRGKALLDALLSLLLSP